MSDGHPAVYYKFTIATDNTLYRVAAAYNTCYHVLQMSPLD